MKFSRAAAVLAAAVVLVGGVTVAVHAATTSDSTLLCVQKNAAVGSVYAPGAGVSTCQKGFKPVEFASADAVQALQGSVSSLQTEVDQQASEITTLQNRLAAVAKVLVSQDPGVLDVSAKATDLGEYQVHATGSALEPGANVQMQTKVLDISMGAVAADGTFSSFRVSICSSATLPWTFTSTTALGNPITTQITSCP